MKKLLLITGVFTAFLVGYGTAALAFPGSGMFGRGEYRGYFDNNYDTSGTYVFPNSYSGEAIPSSVDSAYDFINFIKYTQLDTDGNGSSNTQEKTGAAFLIQTMIGSSRDRTPTSAEIAEWEARVYYAESKGRITWRTNYSYAINSFYQGPSGGGSPNDDAFYDDSGTASAIVFRNASGGVAYAIKWLCANPLGQVTALPDDANWTMSGRSTVSDATPQPGDTITFNHYVRNGGPTATGQDIWSETRSSPSGTVLVPGHNTGTYNSGQEKLVDTRNVVIPLGTPVGTRYCQYVVYDYASSAGARNGTGTPVCAEVSYNPTPSCGGLTANPSIFGPTDSYVLTGRVNVTDGLPGAQAVDSASNFFIHVTGPGVNVVNDNVTPVTLAGTPTSPGAGSLTASINPSATNNAGRYTVSYGIVGPLSPISCPPVYFDVLFTPYFFIEGGDVAAGPGFGTACNSALSKVIGNNLGSGSNYFGAASQLGAFAQGQITGFATNTSRILAPGPGAGSNSSGGSATQPSGLAFSNTGASSTIWGTSFGKNPVEDPVGNSNWCVPDYYGGAQSGSTSSLVTAVPGTLTQADVNGLTSGRTYIYNGNLTISGAITLGGAAPSRIALLVDGNVIMNNGVSYAAYNYVSGTTSISSIPQFRLITKGNIFIGKNVADTYGFYVAQPDPDDANTGTVYTCSSGMNYLTNTPSDNKAYYLTDANYYADCSVSLTINGSVAAKRVMLNRSGGNWKTTPTVTNSAAERVVYSPELWLGGLSAGVQAFDAITSLPPIL